MHKSNMKRPAIPGHPKIVELTQSNLRKQQQLAEAQKISSSGHNYQLLMDSNEHMRG